MREPFKLDTESVRTNLLELASLNGWEALRLASGETVGGSEAVWRDFVATAPEDRMRLAHDAAWAAWVDTTVLPSHEKRARRWFREPVRLR